ncbi:hypothetical protein [uncultured Sphingomonas sp.]|nr:hypothetical protein [uncultured Sphingomonas sp.]
MTTVWGADTISLFGTVLFAMPGPPTGAVCVGATLLVDGRGGI